MHLNAQVPESVITYRQKKIEALNHDTEFNNLKFLLGAGKL